MFLDFLQYLFDFIQGKIQNQERASVAIFHRQLLELS